MISAMALTGGMTAYAADCSELNTALRQEAECGDFVGLEVANDAYSGGKAINVDGQNGYIDFVFEVPSAGLYKLIIADAAAFGQKHYAVSLNGGPASDITGLEAYGENDAGSFRFKEGTNTVRIMPGWTWFAIDYVRIEADQDAVKQVVPSASLSDPNATDAAKMLYNFLLANWGKKTISGFMTGDMSTASKGVKGHEDVAAVYNASGKYPALVGFDMLNATGSQVDKGNSWYLDYTNSAINLSKELWSLGGIPAFTWHWYDPSRSKDAFYTYNPNSTEEKYLKGTEFKFTSAMDASGDWDKSSTVYKNIIKDIDQVADHFLDLQKEGIAAIWRPLHEASGAWFWWGVEGGANYGKLYRLIYDEMVNVKGVHNLVWVWNPCKVGDVDWNPGEAYYDVISIDIYNPSNDHQSNYVSFNTLKNTSNYGKLIALSENGPIPDIKECAENEAVWSWWMPWYQSWSGNFASQTSNAVWKSNMDDERVITLEDMPGWENSGVESVANDAAIVYPTKVANYFMVDADNATIVVTNALGQNVVSKKVNGSTMVPTSNWSKGVYVVKVVSNKGEKTYKLIK